MERGNGESVREYLLKLSSKTKVKGESMRDYERRLHQMRVDMYRHAEESLEQYEERLKETDIDVSMKKQLMNFELYRAANRKRFNRRWAEVEKKLFKCDMKDFISDEDGIRNLYEKWKNHYQIHRNHPKRFEIFKENAQKVYYMFKDQEGTVNVDRSFDLELCELSGRSPQEESLKDIREISLSQLTVRDIEDSIPEEKSYEEDEKTFEGKQFIHNCPMCAKLRSLGNAVYYDSPHALEAHFNRNHNLPICGEEFNMQCSLCDNGVYYRNSSVLEAHFVLKHNLSISIEKKTCSRCAKVFSNTQSFLLHLQTECKWMGPVDVTKRVAKGRGSFKKESTSTRGQAMVSYKTIARAFDAKFGVPVENPFTLLSAAGHDVDL